MDGFTSKYYRLDLLGEGTFGRVHVARRISDGKLFAAKETTPSRDRLTHAYIEQEVRLMRILKHPNIVAFEEAFERPDKSWVIVMEYCEAGDLFTQLSDLCEEGISADEDWIRSTFYQILLALHHCHTPVAGRGAILHRDIKPENVLFTRDGVVKLADFGLAKLMRDQAFATSVVGTPHYLAPEVAARQPYSQKADMYSLGCLLLNMCALDTDWPSEGPKTLATILPAHTAQDLRHVLAQLLQADTSKRPSTAGLLATPTLASWFVKTSSNTKVEARDDEARLQAWSRTLATQASTLRKQEAALLLREAEASATKAAATALAAVVGNTRNLYVHMASPTNCTKG